MRPSATNVGLTAYVQNDSGEYTPQPFEMMSESQMVVFEHHIVGISVAVRATLTRSRAQTRNTCHVSRATLMPSPVCARHQMILKKKPGRRPYSMSAFTFKVIYVVTSASHPKCFESKLLAPLRSLGVLPRQVRREEGFEPRSPGQEQD